MNRAARLALVVVATVVLQVTVFPHLRLLGAVPDLGLVLTAAVAYREGPEVGALVGFASGLGYDLFLETPVGLSALSFALVGYAVGVMQSGLLRSPAWVAPVLGGLAGLVGGLLFASIGVISGSDHLLAWRTLAMIARSSTYDALLAPLVFALVGRLSRSSAEPAVAWRPR